MVDCAPHCRDRHHHHRVGDLSPEDHGMRRPGALSIAILAAALLAVLVWLYSRYFLGAHEGTLSWVRGETTYALRSPKLLGLLLVTPFFLLILPRSLADLPWPQKLLSLALRIAFVAMLALSVARVARTEHADKVCTVFL